MLAVEATMTISGIRHRMRATCIALALCLFATGPAWAVYHIAALDEVMSGVGADPTAQYLEVRMLAVAQGQLAGVRISAWNCSGGFIGVLATLQSTICNELSGSAWSIGTASWNALHPATLPDFTMTEGIPQSCGTVCWGAPGGDEPAENPPTWDASNPGCYTGCLQYGGATAPTSASCPPNFPPPADVTALAAGDGTNSLQRTLPVVFSLATPTPTNDGCTTTTTTTTIFGQTTTTGAGTTSTTLPSGCAADISFDALACRLSELATAVADATTLGAAKTPLAAKVTAAQTSLGAAQAKDAAGKRGGARRKLAKARKALVKFGKRIGKLAGVPGASTLGLRAAGIAADIGTLRDSL